MAEDPDDPEAAADRLEAALERIAAIASVPPARSGDAADGELTIPEIAERLDSLIARLRAAVGVPDGTAE